LYEAGLLFVLKGEKMFKPKKGKKGYEALRKIAVHSIKDCYFCGAVKIDSLSRVITNFNSKKGQLYIRMIRICPKCNEEKIKEIDELKTGKHFDLRIFDV